MQVKDTFINETDSQQSGSDRMALIQLHCVWHRERVSQRGGAGKKDHWRCVKTYTHKKQKHEKRKWYDTVMCNCKGKTELLNKICKPIKVLFFPGLNMQHKASNNCQLVFQDGPNWCHSALSLALN